MRARSLVAAGATAAALVGGVALAAPAQALPGDPQSRLAPGLELPAATAQVDKSPGTEYWTVGNSYEFTVDLVRRQLPVGASYDGLAWCMERDTGPLGIYPTTSWSWGDADDLLKITVADEWVVSITVTRGAGVDCDPNEHFC